MFISEELQDVCFIKIQFSVRLGRRVVTGVMQPGQYLHVAMQRAAIANKVRLFYDIQVELNLLRIAPRV